MLNGSVWGKDLATSDEAKKRFNSLFVESILEYMDFGEIILCF
jgi:hypothetical protein